MRYLAAPLLLAIAGWAGKLPPAGSASNPVASVEAHLYVDREAMKTLVGQDPGPNIIIVEVALTPAKGKTVDVKLDDFLLRSDRDGQKSQPFTPTQIAGSTVMVISSQAGSQGGGMGDNRGPVFGIPGIPGIGRRPQSLPGNQPTAGSATADTSEAVASVDEKAGVAKESPLLIALKDKVLTEKETQEPVKGLLYFVIEDKHKVKDLELLYKTSAGRLSVRFKEPKQ
jgi:hypothetical protein